MNKFLLILFATILFACGNQTNEKAKEEPIEEATEVETSASTISKVLDPNLASRDQMLAIPQLDEATVDSMIARRPYTSPTQFFIVMRELIPEEVLSEVSAQIFLELNLNITQEEDFLMVPGVGKKMAHEFEEYKPYKSIDQFRREIGKYVDDTEVTRYEQYVFVPINLNTASKEEILSIPGVGERMLHEFEEYRPYTSMEQWRREIGKYVDDTELARLERYVTLD